MGEVWFASRPRCPVHGQMRYDLAACRWSCAGWDGEGCDHTVAGEELEWCPLGTVEGIRWREPFPVAGREPGGG